MRELNMKSTKLKKYNHILFVAPNLERGGSQSFFLKLLRYLKNEYGSLNTIIFDYKKKNSYKCDDLNFVTYNRRSILCVFKLYKFIKKNNIKIVFSNQFQANLIIIFVKILLLNKLKIIIRETNSPKQIIKNENNFLSKIIHLYFRKFYKLADHIISPSLQLKKELINSYNIEKKKIHTIYNSFDLRKINILSKKNIPIKYKKIFKKKVFVYHGRLEYQKGLDLLLKAFTIFKNTNYSLLIIGDGSQENDLKKLSNELKLKNQVFFIGFQNNPYNFIKYSKYYVFPSRFEGMPNSLLDAVALSKLIISSDCQHGPKEIISGYPNGILFKTNSINSLKKNLKKISVIKKKKVDQNYLTKFDEKNNFNKLRNLIFL